MPEALSKWSLRDGSHPRAPMAMPADLEKALVAHAFHTYDRKASAGCLRSLDTVYDWKLSLIGWDREVLQPS